MLVQIFPHILNETGDTATDSEALDCQDKLTTYKTANRTFGIMTSYLRSN